jgi:2-iminobutanoate/2-iminopropanoate deaminase
MRQAVVPPGSAKPSAPYSPGVIENGFLYVAGQGPLDLATGEYQKADIRTETRRVFDNIRAILGAAGSSLEKVVKCNVYLRDINDFAAMNEVYASVFSAPYPARTTIQAGALPRGFAVEIECIASL